MNKVLEVSASARSASSASRQLTKDLVAALDARHGDMQVRRRDLAKGVPLINEAWVEANFTPEASRTDSQLKTLAFSDELVAELKETDILVIGTPLYNFSIPAALKAWIDMITRARLTFRYTENGPEGLLAVKKAYVIMATGGVPAGSAADFATPYLRHALAFIGITDVEFIAADRLNSEAEESMDRARARIAELVHLAPRAA